MGDSRKRTEIAVNTVFSNANKKHKKSKKTVSFLVAMDKNKIKIIVNGNKLVVA